MPDANSPYPTEKPEEADYVNRVEAPEIIRAIHHGEVDALVVEYGGTERVFTLEGADSTYRILIEAMNDGVVTLSPDGVILYANRRYAEMSGIPLEQAMGSSILGCLEPVDHEVFLSLVRRGLRTSTKAEMRLVANDRHVIHALMSFNQIPLSPQESACLVTMTDVTELREIQRYLQDLNETLETRVKERTEELSASEARLREESQRKDEFIATLSHELRGPLSPIRAGVEIMRRCEPMDPRLVRVRDIIDHEVTHMSRLIDGLLDVSRITRRIIDLRLETVNVADTVRHAIENCRTFLDERGHRLVITLPSSPLYLRADPIRLEQIVVNLLQNAAKFTPSNGRIDLSCRREGDEAVLRVRDNGVGIEADLLPHIFDLFTQADRSLDRSEGGLGIGLSLVKQLTEQLEGSVAAASEGSGKGSEFTIRFPALREGTSKPGDSSHDGGLVVTPTRILVVEDNRDAATVMSDLLEMDGHVVRAVFDGAAAMEQAKEFAPQVVLLDIGLPGMDGYEVAVRLRECFGPDDMALVALTGYGSEKDRRRTREAGFTAHLMKPVDYDELRRLLAEINRP